MFLIARLGNKTWLLHSSALWVKKSRWSWGIHVYPKISDLHNSEFCLRWDCSRNNPTKKNLYLHITSYTSTRAQLQPTLYALSDVDRRWLDTAWGHMREVPHHRSSIRHTSAGDVAMDGPSLCSPDLSPICRRWLTLKETTTLNSVLFKRRVRSIRQGL